MSDVMIAFRLWCHPGFIVERSLLKSVLDPFVGSNRLLDAPTFPGLPGTDDAAWNDDPAAWLADHLAGRVSPAFLAGPAKSVRSKGGRGFLEFRFTLTPDLSSAITGLIDADRSDDLVEVLAGMCDLLGCPFGYVGPEAELIRRERAHLFAKIDADVAGKFSPLDAADGLCGVPWRLIAGPAAIDLLGGSSALAKEAGEMVERIGHQSWVLSGSTDLVDWSGGAADAQERTLMSALGSEKFFDVDSAVLPSDRLVIQPPAHQVALAGPDSTFEIRAGGVVVEHQSAFVFR